MTNALWIAGHIVIAGICVVLAIIDWREHRLPNRLVLATTITVAATLVVGALGGDDVGTWWGRALLGALIFSGPLLLINLVAPSAMGFGDVKLTAALGLLIGWYSPEASLHALLWAFILSFPLALVMTIKQRRARKSPSSDASPATTPEPPGHLAFGPYLIAGAAIAIAINFALPT